MAQKLQAARRDLALEAAIWRLHKFHLVVAAILFHLDGIDLCPRPGQG